MIYRLKELQGDTIAVPQLVFSKLGIAEEYNVRVALYVLATGITDPDKICADLKLRSRISAESALSFWAGAGLLERYEENAAPGAEPSAAGRIASTAGGAAAHLLGANGQDLHLGTGCAQHPLHFVQGGVCAAARMRAAVDHENFHRITSRAG